MKQLMLTLILLAYCPAILGQTQRLQTKDKSGLYYVELNGQEGIVYPVLEFYDLGASGYYMGKIDTLKKQPDSSYAGGKSRIVREKDRLYLIRRSGRTRKFQLNIVPDTLLANEKKNNAYYQREYNTMSVALNNAYPFNYHSFRNAFSTWKLVPGKQTAHLQFKVWADKRLKEIKDSVSASQNQYAKLAYYITQNIRNIEYTVLKDSLVQLPAEYTSYFGALIDTIAMQRPEFFFKLAEDLPENRGLIFQNGIYSRRVYIAVKDVEGHDKIKKEFLKERKEHRKMTFKAIGGALVGVGLITWALIALI